MLKRILLCLSWIFPFPTHVFGETYESRHFIIHTDLDPRYILFIQANAEAYYENLIEHYFDTGGGKSIKIYYSETQADTQKLFLQHGMNEKAYYGRYVPSIPAIYTHRLMNEGGGTGLGTLFHEITHHFIHLNYPRAPTWFDEGLACILGEQSRIVKGQLVIGRPNPWREKKLRSMIENGQPIDIKYLASLSSRQFHKNRDNYHPCRALFYWLHETRCLADFMKKAKEKGCTLEVLEQTIGKSCDQINTELLVFIKKHCYAGAYLKDGYETKDKHEKRKAYLKALELKPDYLAAQLALGWSYYYQRQNRQARDSIEQILDRPESIEYRETLKLMGHTHYSEKDYSQALTYYQDSLEYSDYDEYRYELYYWIGSCHLLLKDYENAAEYYTMFLQNNWERRRLPTLVDHAEKYLRQYEQNQAKKLEKVD